MSEKPGRERVYIVEVRNIGATEWRPVERPYLSKLAALNKATALQWGDRLEARVSTYVLLPEGTEYRKAVP